MKTVSVETAKLLKDLGFSQQSYFWWSESPLAGVNLWDCKQLGHSASILNYAAPTVEEILAELPPGFAIGKTMMAYAVCYLNETWAKYYSLSSRDLYDITLSCTAAEAAAKLWIYREKPAL